MLFILDVVLSFSPTSLRSVYSITNGANNDRWRLMDAASDEDDEDWRAFRAKLVMSEGDSSSTDDITSSSSEDDDDLDGFGALFKDTATTTFTPLDPEQWAYDSGKVIEKGAVILGGVEQDFGFGLRQQYFHKAVILVLDYDEATFTKGIILNRPSDRMMDDDVNDGLKWRVWFGGDVQGLDSVLPDIICLHSLKSEEAKEASVKVMKDIQWTSFENAKKLVKKGIASGPDDFWLFAGYAGWGPQQLAGELDRKSWYMCATDSQTLLTELARQSKGVDVREAGLDVWQLLMGMIGKEETANECSGSFDDYMLKEWSLANLAQSDQTGEIGMTKSVKGGMEISSGSVDQLMMDAAQLALSQDISAGTLLRASSADRSPFLLTKQNLHHSLVLVVLEDDNVSLACMLNHPANKGYDVTNSKKERSSIPIRYGGDYAIKGQGAMMWIHCSSKLRNTGIGEPLGKECSIYKCTEEDAKSAISCGVANEDDFLITSGLMVWPKRLGGSLSDEVKQGTFEVVDSSKIIEVFQSLQKQKVLTKDNLERNLEISDEAWIKSARSDTPSRDEKITLTVGIGEGFDEDDESFVFNTDKKVSELSKEAQTKWVATFLLGEPTLK